MASFNRDTSSQREAEGLALGRVGVDGEGLDDVVEILRAIVEDEDEVAHRETQALGRED